MADKCYSIVEYFGGDSGYQCGYCKNSTGNFSHGMWSHTMTVQDYQDLIDRGWRRSGKYVYKPILNKTCCPQYTIRCHALKFQPSKSHKKILKKMNKFLSNGDLPQDEGQHGDSMVCDVAGPQEPSVSCRSEAKCPLVSEVQTESGACPPEACPPGACPPEACPPEACPPGACPPGACPPGACPPAAVGQREESSSSENTCVPPASAPKPGAGADPNRPPCRKAKDLRKERRLQKEQQRQGLAPATKAAPTGHSQSNTSKSLEEFIGEGLSESAAAATTAAAKAAHGLEVRLVRSQPPSPQFIASFDASYRVYRLYQTAVHKDPPEKPSESQVRLVPVNFEDPQFQASYEQSASLYERYQMAVHHDQPDECGESEFRRFLCDSPLEAEHSDDGPDVGYGSFHQQYWLDGRIVAVGVIDILPSCVSSVYLYYDPEFSALSLGSYSALREISFTRQLQKQSPQLCFYYLGFYIHSCPKMRYKGQYRPSDLLCPETFTWVAIERCVPKLDLTRYARFNQDPNAGDVRALKDVGRALVLHRRTVMPFAVYGRKRRGSSDEAEVRQYASLVGQDCAERILLYRS